MIDAAVIDGTDLEFTIQQFLADTSSNQIDVHNATRGCWAVAMDRTPKAGGTKSAHFARDNHRRPRR